MMGWSRFVENRRVIRLCAPIWSGGLGNYETFRPTSLSITKLQDDEFSRSRNSYAEELQKSKIHS